MKRQYFWAIAALLASGLICIAVVWYIRLPHKRFEPEKDPVLLVLRGRNAHGVLTMRNAMDGKELRAPIGKAMLDDLKSIVLGPESKMDASFIVASIHFATIELSSDAGRYVLECHPTIVVDRGTDYVRLWNSSGAYAMTEEVYSLDSSKLTEDDIKALAAVWEKRAVALQSARK